MTTLELRTQFGMKGFFPKIEAFQGIDVQTLDPLRPDLDGAGRLSVLEFPWTRRSLIEAKGPDENANKLLTAGLNKLSTQSGWMGSCQVGTDSSQPTAGQTALGAHVAGTSTIHADNYGAQGSVPYYGWRRRTYRFGAGAAAGNLNEIGIGWGTTGATLIARHRTVNTLNEETTITVLGSEYLDVTYELRYYPPLVDYASTIVLDGFTYDTLTRAALVTNSNHWGQFIGSPIGEYTNANSDWSAWDGEPGDITQNPSGSSVSADNSSGFDEVYNNNSFEQTFGLNVGPTGWNVSGGFRTIRFRSTAGSYQCRFGRQGGGDEKVPKTSAYQIQLKWTIAWAELLGLFALPGSFTLTGSDATLTHNT
jgi:hypothetical protein